MYLPDESPTNQRDQMKLFKAIVVAAFIGHSVVAANPAEAREGWVYMGKGTNGGKIWIKPASSGGYRGYYYDSRRTRKSGQPSYCQVNCDDCTERFRFSDGDESGFLSWTPVMADSIGGDILRHVCF